MKVLSTSWRSAGVAALLASSLLHCSKSVPVAQSTVSEAQAQTDVEYRLIKTQQVRTQLVSIQDTIRPLGSVLHDLGKAVDLKVDQHPGSVLAGLMDRLSQILQSAVSGIVETHPDGSWLIEHPTPLTLTAGQPGTCPRSHVRLSGNKTESGERIVIAISSCSGQGINPGAFETLATVVVGANGARLVTISSATFENLQNSSVGFEPCTLNMDASSNSDFSCTPLLLLSGQQLVSIDHLELRSDAQGTHAAIHVRLSDAEQGELGTADVVVEPDAAAQIRVCTRSQPCGS